MAAAAEGLGFCEAGLRAERESKGHRAGEAVIKASRVWLSRRAWPCNEGLLEVITGFKVRRSLGEASRGCLLEQGTFQQQGSVVSAVFIMGLMSSAWLKGGGIIDKKNIVISMKLINVFYNLYCFEHSGQGNSNENMGLLRSVMKGHTYT